MANEIIRPFDLPNRPAPVSTEKIPVDNGTLVGGATIQAIVESGRPAASQAEAEAGTNAVKAMTPLTTKQAVDFIATPLISAALGTLATVASTGSYNDLINKPAPYAPFATVLLLLADASLSYTPGPGKSVVAAGDEVLAQGYRYAVAPSAASNQHLTTAGGVKLYVATASVAPEQITGLRNSAAFAAALATGITNIELTPAAEYVFTNKVTISGSRRLVMNGARVSAAPGFTDGQVLGVTVGNVQILGPGEIDGSNLPAISAPFDGTSFIGVSVLIAQNQGSPISGSVIQNILVDENVSIIGGSSGSIAAYFCQNSRFNEINANGSFGSDTFVGCPQHFYHQCDFNAFGVLRVRNAKYKGVGFSSCDNCTAEAIHVHNTNPGHAGLHMDLCKQFAIGVVSTRGGFGFKADNPEDLSISNIVVDCAANALGALVIQGAQSFKVGGGYLRGFNGYGVALSYDTAANINNIDLGCLDIDGGAVSKGDGSIGINVIGSDAFGLISVVHRGAIRNVDFGVKSDTTGTSPIMVGVSLDGVKFDNVKSYVCHGLFRGLYVKNAEMTNMLTLTAGFYIASGLSGGKLVFDGVNSSSIGSAILFNIDDGLGAIQYEMIAIRDASVSGGAALANIGLSSVSSYVRTLLISDNSCRALQTGIILNSASSTPVELNICGNLLLDASDNKVPIDFFQVAASGRWNGVVENNMSGINNKPNNV